MILERAKTWTSRLGDAEELREFRPHVDFLRVIASPRTQLDVYVSTIIIEVLRVLNGDRCSVFFVDENRKEVWSVGSSHCETFSIPWDRGIVGLSAHGEQLNLHDAHAHSAFDPTVEKSTGYVVRTMLSFPIKHMVDESRSVGVIQVLNKQGGPDAVFTEHDEHELQKLAMLITDSFYRQRWRALESGARGDCEAMAVIAAHSRGQDAKGGRTPTGTPGQVMSMSCTTSMAPSRSSQRRFSRRRGGDDSSGPAELPWPQHLIPPGLAGVASRTAKSLRSLSFNALGCTPQELVPLVQLMMGETGCIENCCVLPERLQNWVWAACRLYRDNPFHSWFHGFSVFHICYFQLLFSAVSGQLRYLDSFGLLIAALCHDLDHPGLTNSFLVDIESELALKYNDVSVLENHHAFLACDLLRKEETAIGAGLGRCDQQALRRIVIKCILDTDMSRHRDQCQAAAAAITAGSSPDADASTADDRQFFLSGCIHTSDLSSQVLPWAIAEQWEARISTEFLQQASEELAAGLTPAPFMQFRFEDLKQRGKLQRNFIDFVLVPLWDPYTQLIPELRPCFDNLLRNRCLYDYRSVHGVDAPESLVTPNPSSHELAWSP